MHEDLYAPLPDARAYLDRLGIQGAVSKTPEDLSKLIWAHQTMIPYENYGICEQHLPVELGIEAIFDKVIGRRRGGYCFELNALLHALLLDLGFEAYPLLGRVLREGQAHPAPMHRVTMIIIDGCRYYADVGLGAAVPAGALPFDGKAHTMHGLTFRLEQTDRYNWVLLRLDSEGRWVPSVGFPECPADRVDFIAPNYFCSSGPTAPFATRRVANLRRESGFIDIDGSVFTIADETGITQQEITSPAQERALLREYFGIDF